MIFIVAVCGFKTFVFGEASWMSLLDEQVRFQMIVLSKLCFGAGTGKDMSTSIIQDLSTSTSNGVFATRPL